MITFSPNCQRFSDCDGEYDEAHDDDHGRGHNGQDRHDVGQNGFARPGTNTRKLLLAVPK